jgi:hypothetical protein
MIETLNGTTKPFNKDGKGEGKENVVKRTRYGLSNSKEVVG